MSGSPNPISRELGPRDEIAIGRQRTKEIEQERLTTIDRQLGALASFTDGVGAADHGAKVTRQAPSVAKLPRLQQLWPAWPRAAAKLDQFGRGGGV